MELHLISNILRNIRKIFFVIRGQNHFADALAMRRQQFFFQPADGQHAAAHRDFAGHGEIGAHRNAGQRAADAGGDGDAGRRTVFGDRAFRNVQVNIEVAVEIARQAQILRARLRM